MPGIRWVNDVRTTLIERLRVTGNYANFLEFTDDPTTTPLLNLPRDILPPSGITISPDRFESSAEPAIIFLPRNPTTHITQQPAYVRIADLLMNEDPVLETNLDAPLVIDIHHLTGKPFAVKGLGHAKVMEEQGHNYVLARMPVGSLLGHTSRIKSSSATIGRPIGPQPLILIPQTLTFVPHQDPDFPALQVTLKRQGRPCPVIIERVSVKQAREVLKGTELEKELTIFVDSRRRPDDVPFILLTRTLDGKVEGIALSSLKKNDNQMLMECDRDRKLDLEPQTEIQNVGLAMLIAKFRYMKNRGYWPPDFRSAILTGYDPAVSRAYRERCGVKTFLIFAALNLDSFSRYEGDLFLDQCPLDIREFSTQE